jgi:electron transport complex protein RnfC
MSQALDKDGGRVYHVPNTHLQIKGGYGMKKLRGMLVPHHKNTAKYAPEEMPVPPLVMLSMSMHAGTPAKPVVGVGDYVKVGQVIGEDTGPVSSPVHASVSGTVKSIDTMDSLTGKKTVTITIASDGNQAPFEGIKPPQVGSLEEFLEAVKNSGVIGLGGAGYPTAPKLTLKDYSILDYILVNGAECEPFLTADTRTMTDDAVDLWEGVRLLKKYLKPKNIVLCIENNKPEPIRIMKELASGTDGVYVHELKSRYPQGERKVLVYNVTGRIVPEGKRLTDVGCIVVNCTTVAVFAKYIKTGHPLVSKYVTVDGSGVKTPKNVIAPIGTPVHHLFDFCGGLKDDVKKILLCGPMMGIALPNQDVQVLKTTNGLLAFSGKDAETPVASACIRCGRCVSVCPMRLMPPNIENAVDLNKPELLKKYKVDMCAECGCCAYSCPAKRPLVQVITLSKKMLRSYMALQGKKEVKA